MFRLGLRPLCVVAKACRVARPVPALTLYHVVACSSSSDLGFSKQSVRFTVHSNSLLDIAAVSQRTLLMCLYATNKPYQTVVLHALLGPASLAVNDLEVGSDSLHGPKSRSKSCGETSNTFLRKISTIKHETTVFVSYLLT